MYMYVKFKERSFIVPCNLMLLRSVKGFIYKVHVQSVIQTCIAVKLCIQFKWPQVYMQGNLSYKEVISFPNHSYIKNFNDDVERNKTKVMSLITKKYGSRVEFCFPSKPVFYLWELMLIRVWYNKQR